MEKNYNLTWHPINTKLIKKGDWILLDGDPAVTDGERNDFKVLSYNAKSGIAIVMPAKMWSSSQIYKTDYWTYNERETINIGQNEYIKYTGSLVDNLVNTTYYNSLSSNIKAAIIPWTREIKAIFASNTDESSPLIDKIATTGTTNTRYTYTNRDSYSLTKNIHSLSIEDFEEYIGGNTWSDAQIYEMMFYSGAYSLRYVCWLENPSVNDQSYGSDPSEGTIFTHFDASHSPMIGASNFYAPSHIPSDTIPVVKPVFKIDLNKVAWEVHNP